jgi:hypothetical protein
LILWTKVNTGAYVMVGVAVYLACWAPLGSTDPSSTSGRGETLPLALQVLGLLLVAGGFLAFLRPHLNALYAVYLVLPLTLAIAWTLHHVVQAWRTGHSAKPRVAAACIYLASTLCVSALVFIAYFGIEAGRAYVSEQLAVLSRFHYQVALPSPGARGQYRGFNAYFWPQLPWLMTVTALYWLVTRRRRLAANAPRAAHAEARLAGLFLAGTLSVFVIYARGDEVHLVQGVLGAAAVLFGMFAVIDGAPRARPSAGNAARWGLAAVTGLAATTLVALPRGVDFYPTFGDWGSPRLAYLRYHAETDEREQELTVSMPYDEWDAHIDAAAMQVDQLTQAGEEVLVLSGAQLINYASDTRPAGGKHSHFFYLLRCGLLDRAAFLELMPRRTLEGLLTSPPRVVVWQGGDDAVLRALPELRQALRRTPYRFVSRWGPFAVWVRPTP